MRKLVPKLFLLLLWLSIALPGGAQAITLGELFDGGSITAGDKVFDSWYLEDYYASDFRQFNPANIDVTSLNDGGLNPGPGLNFSVSNGELGIAGDNIYAYIDLMFGFRVSVLDPLLRIKDNSLSLNGFLLYEEDGMNDLGFYIRETIGTQPGADDLGIKDAEVSVLFNELTDEAADSASFSPLDEIWVTKNILVWAWEDTDSATLTQFEQRFSQEIIPEPSTVVLMLLGLVGLVAVGKRKLK